MQAILWLEKPLTTLFGGSEVKVIVGNVNQLNDVVLPAGQIFEAEYSHGIYAEDIESSTFLVKDENGNWLQGVADCRT